MLENFNEGKRKNPMTQFSDFHTGWSIFNFYNNQKKQKYEMWKIYERL